MRETIKENKTTFEFIRNTLLLNQFRKLLAVCGPEVTIIPLKGISLLLRVYAEDLARNVADIDFFIPENEIDVILPKLEKEGYLPRTPDANKNRIKSKRKFDMIHREGKCCDLDIHFDLITKKFFRLTTGDFTAFALTRLHSFPCGDRMIRLLSPVDEFIFLCQHCCFHAFSNDKWLVDLYLIQDKFTEDSINELVAVANRFHFRRVITAVSRHLKHKYPLEKIRLPELEEGRHCLFDFLITHFAIKEKHGFSERIISAYWEFLFIDNGWDRCVAFFKLLFPRFYLLSEIYRVQTPLLCLFYPFHFLIVIFSLFLFFVLTGVVALRTGVNRCK